MGGMVNAGYYLVKEQAADEHLYRPRATEIVNFYVGS